MKISHCVQYVGCRKNPGKEGFVYMQLKNANIGYADKQTTHTAYMHAHNITRTYNYAVLQILHDKISTRKRQTKMHCFKQYMYKLKPESTRTQALNGTHVRTNTRTHTHCECRDRERKTCLLCVIQAGEIEDHAEGVRCFLLSYVLHSLLNAALD